MNQIGFDFVIPVERTRYLVEYNGGSAKAWFMGGVFIFDGYRVEKYCKIIERIGNEEDFWG